MTVFLHCTQSVNPAQLEARLKAGFYCFRGRVSQSLIIVALWNRADHYIFILSFVLSFCLLFFLT